MAVVPVRSWLKSKVLKQLSHAGFAVPLCCIEQRSADIMLSIGGLYEVPDHRKEVREVNSAVYLLRCDLLVTYVMQTRFCLESRGEHQLAFSLGRPGILDEKGRVAGMPSDNKLKRVHTGTAAELAE
jgi:hypothetical protein